MPTSLEVRYEEAARKGKTASAFYPRGTTTFLAEACMHLFCLPFAHLKLGLF